MSRINFAARHDYESLANFKILQNVFVKNRIDKPIPVDRLVRCKMQDNLEFLQWIKKFWDMNYTGEGLYDAEGRRALAPSAGRITPGRRATSNAGARPRPSAAPRPSAVGPRPSAVGPRPSAVAPRTSSTTTRPPSSASPARRMSAAPRGITRAPAVSNEMINQLTTEIDDMKISVESLERERDFYFGKLRDVEVIVQERLAELFPSAEDEEELVDPSRKTEADLLKQIQGVLYKTEEGFELPDAAEVCLCIEPLTRFRWTTLQRSMKPRSFNSFPLPIAQIGQARLGLLVCAQTCLGRRRV